LENVTTWFLIDLWLALPWVQPARLDRQFLGGTLAGSPSHISWDHPFEEVAEHSGIYDNRSDALCR